MKQSIADTLKLESNFCIKRLIRLCKDNDKFYLSNVTTYDYFFTFEDDSTLAIKDNVIKIDNDLVKYWQHTSGVNTFNILAKQE